MPLLPSLSPELFSAAALGYGVLILGLAFYLFKERWSQFGSLKHLQGPPSPSYVFGNVLELQHQEDAGEVEREWLTQYGDALTFKGSFGEDVLMLADPKALHHIFQLSGYNYPKRSDVNQSIRLMMGRGIFWAVGEDHKRHKKVMYPAFEVNKLKSFLPLFQRSAQKLSNIWKNEISKGNGSIDVTDWLSRLMLDNIGEAAFEHHFNALDGTQATELSEAFENLFADSLLWPAKETILFTSTWRFIPPNILRFVEYLPARQVRRFRRFLRVSKQAARNVIKQRVTTLPTDEDDKDILSILVRSNSSVDAKKRLDEDELLSQMATIMLAGHDSTANSLSWLLYDLSLHVIDQDRIRQEIAAFRAQSDDPDCLSISDFEGMTYTNAAIRESLRLHPIAFMLPREVGKDDVIPLATPIVSKSGELISEIQVKKGQSIYAAVYTYNRLPSVWGDDANQWNPGRFLGNAKEKQHSLGMFSNLLTFSGGVRGCLGWRFAVLELQATLIGLIEHFDFAPPPKGVDIHGAPAGSMIPVIRGRAREGTQLPLCISIRKTPAET